MSQGKLPLLPVLKIEKFLLIKINKKFLDLKIFNINIYCLEIKQLFSQRLRCIYLL